MTRGLGCVLTLPSRGLASGAATAPIFYRFISAHWVSSLVFYSLNAVNFKVIQRLHPSRGSCLQLVACRSTLAEKTILRLPFACQDS
jgi:hypothetical protein